MNGYRLLVTTCLFARLVCGSQKVFSINDDIFAYPQYEVVFPAKYILEHEAERRLTTSGTRSASAPDVALHHDGSTTEQPEESNIYQRMTLRGNPHLCSIPQVRSPTNTSETAPSEEDQKQELIRAADRGWELLKDMEGKQCLYSTTGWWSYSFCYNSHVKQFHGLPPGATGGRPWPPQEDVTTPSYVLGRYVAKATKKSTSSAEGKHLETELQRKAESSYLVQWLSGGTACDLTGDDRNIEVQFHCHPQATDHIGWIKEVSTCSYLMIIYTPRLCSDVAFQPPKDSRAHTISCQQIVSEDQISSHEKPRTSQDNAQEQIDPRIMIGSIEVGAMQAVGREGKRIDKGRIVMTAEEKAEVVMMQKDGQLHGLSRTELKKLNLSPETVEAFKKQLQEIAGDKDWKIERLDGNGQIQLRGIVSDDEEDEPSDKQEEDVGGAKDP